MRIECVPVGEVPGQNPFRQLANDFQIPLGVIISAGEILANYFDRLTPERRQIALNDILNAARQMSQSFDSLASLEQGGYAKSPRARRSKIPHSAS